MAEKLSYCCSPSPARCVSFRRVLGRHIHGQSLIQSRLRQWRNLGACWNMKVKKSFLWHQSIVQVNENLPASLECEWYVSFTKRVTLSIDRAYGYSEHLKINKKHKIYHWLYDQQNYVTNLSIKSPQYCYLLLLCVCSNIHLHWQATMNMDVIPD